MIAVDYEPPAHELPAQAGSRLPLPAMTAVLLAASVLALIVIAAEAVWLRPRHDKVTAQHTDRAAVLAAANQFMVEWNTFSYTDLDTYKRDVESLMSTKFKSDFDAKFADVARLATAAKLTSGSAAVLKTGVASLDPDSAQVLVVADATAKNVQETRNRHFRWAIDLVKVDGRWVVDSFEPVLDGGAQ